MTNYEASILFVNQVWTKFDPICVTWVSVEFTGVLVVINLQPCTTVMKAYSLELQTTHCY